MAAKAYSIEILSNTTTFVAPVQVLWPINSAGDTIYFTYRLSNWGQLKFRVGTKDPLFTTVGDVLTPYRYHARVKHYGVTVWQGVIVKNPRRNKDYVEVVAYSYLFLLSKVLIRHDASVTAGDGKDNYRTFSSGTMSSAITTLLSDAIADAGTGSPLASMTNGTIENPNYPTGYQTSAGAALTGAWNFTSDITLQFDYRDVFFVLSNFAVYTSCDFELTTGMVFNFQQFLGTKQPQLTFTYGAAGNVLDYDIPRDGERMANALTGVAADFGNQILHVEQSDEASIQTYGKIADVAAFIDVKNTNALKSRLVEELRLISQPDAEVHIVLNDRAPALGQFHVGDIVTINIQDHVISFNKPRRIVGINVSVADNGSDSVRLITNKPKDGI